VERKKSARGVTPAIVVNALAQRTELLLRPRQYR
jgi:hypothetical protein